jgi:hypothetical protein
LPNWYSVTVKRSSSVFWHVLEWTGHIHTVAWIIESLGISGTVAWAVAVAMRYGGAHSDWTLSAVIFVGLSALLIVPPLLYRRRSRTHAIQFIYRDQPTGHMWTLAKEKTAGVQPTLTPVPGAPLPGSVSIGPGGPYALDYEVEPQDMICERVKLAAKISRNTIFYTLVRVAEAGGTNFRSVWLAHVFGVGNEPPKKTSDSEWTVYTTGEDLGKGWMRFDLSLPEEVLKTYGTEGLVYRDQLLTVRLRGALSISPIDLDRADRQMNNPKKGVVRISAGVLILLSLTTVFGSLRYWHPGNLQSWRPAMYLNRNPLLSVQHLRTQKSPLRKSSHECGRHLL